jgi:hypothetical protein
MQRAEQQLAQRKAELDTREKALDEREKALAEKEKAIARAAMIPADAQLRALKRDGSSGGPPSATIPPGLAPPDNSQLKASREKRIEELRAVRQRRMEAIQKMRSMRPQPNSGAGAPADTSESGNTQRVCRYQHLRRHWRGGDFTISVVHAPVSTRR